MFLCFAVRRLSVRIWQFGARDLSEEFMSA